MFCVKISLVCLARKWIQVANSRNFHHSFENEMACYSPNFGNDLQMMVAIGKEYSFTSNFDMPRPFT